MDFVKYQDSGNWENSADALGAGQKDLPADSPFSINYATYKYKGQTLNRRVVEWPGEEGKKTKNFGKHTNFCSAYNWKAADPTPGISTFTISNTSAAYTSVVPILTKPKIKNVTAGMPLTVQFSVRPLLGYGRIHAIFSYVVFKGLH